MKIFWFIILCAVGTFSACPTLAKDFSYGFYSCKPDRLYRSKDGLMLSARVLPGNIIFQERSPGAAVLAMGSKQTLIINPSPDGNWLYAYDLSIHGETLFKIDVSGESAHNFVLFSTSSADSDVTIGHCTYTPSSDPSATDR